MALLRSRNRDERRPEALARIPNLRGVNPDVERREMQPEHLGAHDHVRKRTVRDPLPAMCTQRGLERAEIAEQRPPVRVAVVGEPPPDPHQLDAVRLGHVGLQFGCRTDEVGGHPPGLAETTDLALEELPREQARTLQRLVDRLGAGIRVAVHVTADPRAEAEGNGDTRQISTKPAGELRHGVPEARLEEPQAMADLVHDQRTSVADLVRLPEDRDLLGERVLDLCGARRRQRRVVQLAQERDDSPVGGEHRPTRGLGRVRGDDRRDVRSRERRLELVVADPGAAQALDRVLERLPRHAALVLVLAPAPEPVVLLGDVRELEEERERP